MFVLFRKGKGFISFKDLLHSNGVSHHQESQFGTAFTSLNQAKNHRDANLKFGPIDIIRL